MISSQLNTADISTPKLFSKLTLFRLLILILLLLWCLGILYPLLFAHIKDKLFEFFFAQLYSTVCHQYGEKCISIDGKRLLVCARCTGIYYGALMSAVVIFSFKKIKIKEKILFISLSVILIDVFFVLMGIYEFSKTISFITGLIFGGAVYLYLISELEKFVFTLIINPIK